MYALLIRLPHSIIVDALNKGSTDMNKKMQPCMAMAGKKTRSVPLERERESERKREIDHRRTLVGEWFSGARVPMAMVVRRAAACGRQWRKKGAESMGDARGEAGRCDDDCSCRGERKRRWTGLSPFLYSLYSYLLQS